MALPLALLSGTAAGLFMVSPIRIGAFWSAALVFIYTSACGMFFLTYIISVVMGKKNSITAKAEKGESTGIKM